MASKQEVSHRMGRLYRYVGPKHLVALADAPVNRVLVRCPQDIRRWIEQTGQELDPAGCVFATYIVDTEGHLWIADRRIEHIACGRGQPVQSAGEIVFCVKEEVDVEYVTNQSTGYCPEPESWPAVAGALTSIGIEHPDSFSQEFLFRRCGHCGCINLIKNAAFECAVCGSELETTWNLQ